MADSKGVKYPFLQEILDLKGLKLKPMYTNRDLAEMFGVSVRAIQVRIAAGKLKARDLPGRARFLPADLEEFLANSRVADVR